MAPIFRRITVPVDGSSTAERGVAFALELARGGGAVVLCSVVDPSLVCMPVSQGVAIDFGSMLAVLDDDAAVFCERAAARAAAAGIPAETEILHGGCVASIISLAAGNASDAIVIATHGRTGIARAMLGSVAEGVLRESVVPVAVVHEKDEMRTGPIVVAIDSSPAALAALDTAIGMAKSRATPITLVHVREEGNGAVAPADSVLSGALSRTNASGIEATIVTRIGMPSVQILALAEQLEACMIVMGTHGRALLSRIIVGSVAASVVERARIPVITVRRAA